MPTPNSWSGKQPASINYPSRRFPYVRFAQFHYHQVHFKCISFVFRVGKMKYFCVACTKWCGIWLVFLKKTNFACVFIQFCPRIMWNLTSFGIGSARITCVIASKWERQNVACVVYSSSFLSKNCRNQCAFRVVLLFFSVSLWCRTSFFWKCCFPNDTYQNTDCALCFLLHFRSKLSWWIVFVRIRVGRLIYLHWNARK